MREVHVGSAAEIAASGRKVIASDGEEIGVFLLDGAYYAWANNCPHQGGPICQGIMMKRVEEMLDDDKRSLGMRYVEADDHIVCPWHGYEFNLRTGRHPGLPSIRLHGYDVSERGGEIYVVIGD